MWVMTNFGFISIVRRPASDIAVGDPRVMQVRARDAKTLRQLRKLMPTLSPMVSTPDRDYQYRAFCTSDELVAGMARLGETITYDNFKDSVRDRKLHDLCIKMWSLVYRHHAN
jgi:hypothetical protein